MILHLRGAGGVRLSGLSMLCDCLRCGDVRVGGKATCGRCARWSSSTRGVQETEKLCWDPWNLTFRIDGVQGFCAAALNESRVAAMAKMGLPLGCSKI